MKSALSLSDAVAEKLASTAKVVSNGNASLLADLALTRLLALPTEELKSLVRRHDLNRKAITRDGWMKSFWLILGEEMGQSDRIDNPYAPRNFGAFYVVLLFNHAGGNDDESDPFIPYVGPRVATPERRPSQQWSFDRQVPPVKAAETVAATLRDLATAEGR